MFSSVNVMNKTISLSYLGDMVDRISKAKDMSSPLVS